MQCEVSIEMQRVLLGIYENPCVSGAIDSAGIVIHVLGKEGLDN